MRSETKCANTSGKVCACFIYACVPDYKLEERKSRFPSFEFPSMPCYLMEVGKYYRLAGPFLQ